SFSIAPYDTANCSSTITGNAETYDADAPDDAWTHTMNTLAGLNIINPFTDIASILSKISGNESLTQDELKAKVLALLGYSDSDDLFTDYSTNSKVALLAQAVFDVTIQTLAALGDNYSAANMEALYEKILPNVVTAVNEAIELAENNGSSISTISISLNLGTLSFNEDGSVDTDTLNATVEAEVIYTDDNVATGATGGTGAVSSSTGG
ncbi:MAG: hypothetical protein WBM99_16275, partial [Psychromonas sp.]